MLRFKRFFHKNTCKINLQNRGINNKRPRGRSFNRFGKIGVNLPFHEKCVYNLYLMTGIFSIPISDVPVQ